MKRLNLKGNRFCRLLVLRYHSNDKYQRTKWLCQCECGNKKIIAGYTLKAGSAKSCGCLQKEKAGLNKADMIDREFGDLTVIAESDRTNKGRQVKWLCKCRCGRKVIIAGYRLKQGLKRCRLCAFQKRGKIVSGKNHYNWKGGITPITAKIRQSVKYAKWRRKILQRDNYTCQRCNKNNCDLNVHHIYPFAVYPEIRWDKLNAITLCLDCHGETRGKEDRYREKFLDILNQKEANNVSL